jgi:hypothetical protein
MEAATRTRPALRTNRGKEPAPAFAVSGTDPGAQVRDGVEDQTMPGDRPADSGRVKRGDPKNRDASLKNSAEKLPATEQGGFAVISPDPPEDRAQDTEKPL